MTAIGTRNVLLSIMLLGGLAGCSSMPGGGQNASTGNSEATRTSQSAQSVPEDVVKTGMSQAEPSDPGMSQNQDASAGSTQTATEAPPSGERGHAVQVSCPEPTAAQPGQCFTRVLYPPQFKDGELMAPFAK